MAEILGLGMTHTPAMLRVDEDVAGTLRRLLGGSRIPERLKDPRNWPAPMQKEWGDDKGVANGREHRERCFAASRVIRQRLDAFKPDAVVIFGDDQYENFTEECLPPFCVYITDPMESRPFAPGAGTYQRNVWNEGPDTGIATGAKWCACKAPTSSPRPWWASRIHPLHRPRPALTWVVRSVAYWPDRSIALR